MFSDIPDQPFVIPDVIGDPCGPGFSVGAGNNEAGGRNDGRGGCPVVAGNDGFPGSVMTAFSPPWR
jgi:hypothetical protein